MIIFCLSRKKKILPVWNLRDKLPTLIEEECVSPVTVEVRITSRQWRVSGKHFKRAAFPRSVDTEKTKALQKSNLW